MADQDVANYLDLRRLQNSSIFTFVFLKVGSCSNNDNSVQIFFCPFLSTISIILFFESVAAEKTANVF